MLNIGRGKIVKLALGAILPLCVLLVLVIPARGFIDPNFTPVDLVNKSDLIFAGLIQADGVDGFKLEKVQKFKGIPAAQNSLDLTECNPDNVNDLKDLLKSLSGKATAIVFFGTLQEEKFGHISLDGKWLDISGGVDGKWKVMGFNATLSGTYAGGTDMMLPFVQYILDEAEDATVPVSANAKWAESVNLGNAGGGVSALHAVLWKDGDPLCLFVASSAGDKLFKPKPEDNSFVDVTGEAKVTSKSVCAAFIDMNRDGLADLVSYDGNDLSVWELSAAGTLKAAGVPFNPQSRVVALSPISITGDGRPAVLLSTDEMPVVASFENGTWKKTQLEPGKVGAMALGVPSRCVVADLDGDGFADVLLPFDGGSVFWRGKQGGFEEAVSWELASGGGAARCALGDFNADGKLDLFMAGEQKNFLWERNVDGSYSNVIGRAGSISYKAPTGISDCSAVDLNNDGRQDLSLLYLDKAYIYHFNRGYRCMGEEGEMQLQLPAAQETPGAGEMGQIAAAYGDFNNDGAIDMAVAKADGSIFCTFLDNFKVPGIRVRLPKGVTGPVTVSVWQGKGPFCCGTHVVSGHTPIFLNVRYSDKAVLKYRLPGKGECEKTVKVENVVDVTLE